MVRSLKVRNNLPSAPLGRVQNAAQASFNTGRSSFRSGEEPTGNNPAERRDRF